VHQNELGTRRRSTGQVARPSAECPLESGDVNSARHCDPAPIDGYACEPPPSALAADPVFRTRTVMPIWRDAQAACVVIRSSCSVRAHLIRTVDVTALRGVNADAVRRRNRHGSGAAISRSWRAM
jgi:hypothetical protein